MKDCRKQKTSHNTSSGVAVFRLAFLRSPSNTHTHKSQAGLSLHDRAKLLWLNTQEYGMIKVSGAFWEEMETWFITLHTTADWNVKRLNNHCVASLFVSMKTQYHLVVGRWRLFRNAVGILIPFMWSFCACTSGLHFPDLCERCPQLALKVVLCKNEHPNCGLRLLS